MIESAQRNNVEIPDALIYTAMVWMMASPGKPYPNNSVEPPVLSLNTNTNLSPLGGPSTAENRSPVMVAIENSPDRTQKETPTIITSPSGIRQTRQRSLSIHGSTTELIDSQAQRSPIEMQNMTTGDASVGLEEEEEESGLKLGLGDFVFYSVLVGRASLFDWITTIGCILAVITGLVLTIILLVAKKRPLPALPISIVLGITIFFVSTLTLSPMLESLLGDILPSPLLRAGSPGVGFLYL
jgi:hypothetical protein